MTIALDLLQFFIRGHAFVSESAMVRDYCRSMRADGHKVVFVISSHLTDLCQKMRRLRVGGLCDNRFVVNNHRKFWEANIFDHVCPSIAITQDPEIIRIMQKAGVSCVPSIQLAY